MTQNIKTKILDVSSLNEETIKQARMFADAQALAKVDAALDLVNEAAAILGAGGLVAFPTETVYGLGGNALDVRAVARIYAAKGRPSDNPMIVHIARAGDISELTVRLSPEIVKLADCFWPGPLTMILEKSPSVPSVVTGGLDSVAVRLPDHPVALELIRAAGCPVAAPSANLSGSPSPTQASHVVADLDGRVDCILAAGSCRVGIESTVVDLTASVPTILRPGVITADMISAAIDRPVIYDPALRNRLQFLSCASDAQADSSPPHNSQISSDNLSDQFSPQPSSLQGISPPSQSSVANDLRDAAEILSPKSPGMKYRHYAPKAEMLVVEGRRDKVQKEIERLRGLNEQLGSNVGILLFEEKAFFEAAHDFYAHLRALDDEGVDLILAGALSDADGVGFAVMNRMMKSAGYNIVRV
jgi:L-threonylcarbamoyladenylate synthase